jgi:hypothetical protein
MASHYGTTIVPARPYIGDPTLADAILDRLVHNAHRLNLNGDSLRRINAKRELDADAKH